jgi:peptidyl-prolyl cis-trans isomerase B (cyclophilin B)
MSVKAFKRIGMKNSIMLLMATMVVFAAGCGAQSESKEGKQNMEKVEYVVLSTELGDLKIMLYNETPLHKENFLKLVEEGYYDGLLFHRVINNFMIQGGDPNSRTAEDGTPLGAGGPEYKLDAEIIPGLYHKKGALAAARQGDAVNPQKQSSGSQLYIVDGQPFDNNQLAGFENRSGIPYTDEQKQVYNTIGGTPHLDHNYTVFGEVVEGLDVIDKIAAVQTGGRDRPAEDIRMTIKRVKK